MRITNNDLKGKSTLQQAHILLGSENYGDLSLNLAKLWPANSPQFNLFSNIGFGGGEQEDLPILSYKALDSTIGYLVGVCERFAKGNEEYEPGKRDGKFNQNVANALFKHSRDEYLSLSKYNEYKKIGRKERNLKDPLLSAILGHHFLKEVRKMYPDQANGAHLTIDGARKSSESAVYYVSELMKTKPKDIEFGEMQLPVIKDNLKGIKFSPLSSILQEWKGLL